MTIFKLRFYNGNSAGNKKTFNSLKYSPLIPHSDTIDLIFYQKNQKMMSNESESYSTKVIKSISINKKFTFIVTVKI